ncbi:MAG: S8 family serine peptidase, partial [Fimbriimonadales bacterium]|nr:S8 family serine peptidase [Fimbriimonadales bacterium]
MRGFGWAFGVVACVVSGWSQVERPTPAPWLPQYLVLERSVPLWLAPRPPQETALVLNARGEVIAPIYQTVVGQTRAPRVGERAWIGRGLTHAQDASSVGRNAGNFVLPFGSKGEPSAIAFGQAEFSPPADEKLQPELLFTAFGSARETLQGAAARSVYALILLHGRLDAALQARLRNYGVQLLGFYPYTAYLARIPAASLLSVATDEGVRWVGQPPREFKIDPILRQQLQSAPNTPVEVYINLFEADTVGTVLAELQALGVGEIRYYEHLPAYYAVASAAQIAAMLEMNSVLFIEPVPVSYAALHTESQPSVNADQLWGTEYDGRPVNGRQVKIGVMDSGVNIYHRDFANLAGGMFGFNRTTEQNWWNDLHGHGTHVSGTLFGAGLAQFRYRGFAAGFQESPAEPYDMVHSKVFRYDPASGRAVSEGNSVMEGYLDMRGRGDPALKRHLFNYSGGASGLRQTGTDAGSRTVDLLFGEDIVAVVSAGNDGPGAGTIKRPAVAKGAMAVGAIEDDELNRVDTVTNYSSRGPTGDNRAKPDVVAPGRAIDSTHHLDTTGYLLGLSGTSMAAPHVAGLVATLRQAYPTMPAWGVRSTIMATAIDLGYDRNTQGLGKIDALLAHFGWGGGWYTYWWENAETGNLRYFDVNIPDSCSKLRVVLVYPDPPAAAGASVALKNDLDLYLQQGALDETPAGNWSATSRFDNVEVIEVRNPPAGAYRVKVYTYAQNEGARQPWAVTVHWVQGSATPSLQLSLSAPVAVRPSTTFSVEARVAPSSYVATGVFVGLRVPSLMVIRRGMTYFRRAPDGGEESLFFPDVPGKNLGNIGSGRSRRAQWSLSSGASEGNATIELIVASRNGGSGSVQATVIIDGTPPGAWGEWQNFQPTGVVYGTPVCSVQVRDWRSGLSRATAAYRYSTDGGATWSDWLPAQCTGVDGSTQQETISTPPIRFPPSRTQNRVQFQIADRAGNLGVSPAYTVQVERRAGDVNGDGCVNDIDLLLVLLNFGSPGGQGDANGDGVVDSADL